MGKSRQTDLAQPQSWRSLQMQTFASGYRIREDARRFRGEVRSEIALRFTGIALLLGGWFMWLLPSVPLAEAALWSKIVLSGSFGVIGLGLFLWANRGFRREIRVDMSRRELRICKLNARGQAMITERLPMRAVSSIYVRRQERDGASTLEIRIDGRRPIAAMRGPQDDLTALHRLLCQDMIAATYCAARPSRIVRSMARARAIKPLFGPRVQPA